MTQSAVARFEASDTIPFAILQHLACALDAVLRVLYLIFTEGTEAVVVPERERRWP